MITLKIDDKETSVADGTLIIEAAKGLGIEIPHFCYHPKLSISGSCKMCLVEVEGMPKLVTSCITPVTQNMVVRTKSERVKEAQRDILALLLINHPLDCPVCDKGGECPLQNFTYKYGPGKSEFYDEKWHFKKPVDLSPLIVLDRERCILCTRCVRFQEEVAGDPELEVVDRGRGAYIETTRPEGFTSNFSGNTIELCPVGALTSRPFRFKARPWELKRYPSICPHCGVGCNIYLDVRDNKVLRVLSRENPVDDGWLCDRGRFGYQFVNHSDRLKTPLIKRGNGLVPCSWEDAVSAVIKGVNEAKEKYGKDSIRGIASPVLTNEDLYIFRKFFREIIGSNPLDYASDNNPVIESLSATACSDLRRFSFSDIDEADSIVIINGDPGRDLPVLDLRIKKAVKRGAKLYIAGSEGGFEKRYPDEIRDSKKCVILFGEQFNETEAESLCTMLKELNSNMKGDGWISLGVLMPGANGQGAQDISVPYSGSLTIVDREKCLFVAGRDIPDVTTLRNHLDFLVVYDLFISDTARVADVVLPATAFSEVDGTFTNSERRVQRLFKATKSPGEAKPLWEVIMLMANAMGTGWNYHSPQDVMKEISDKIPLYKFISYENIGMKGSYADGITSSPRCYR